MKPRPSFRAHPRSDPGPPPPLQKDPTSRKDSAGRTARHATVGGAHSRQRGFTLLEVLVAMAILGVAIVASIQGFAAGLRLLKLSGEHQHAMLVADQKLREPVTLEEGRETGTDGALTWERAISVVPGVTGSSTATTGSSTGLTGSSTGATAPSTGASGSLTGASGASTGASAGRWAMYRIEVKVQWEKRSVVLATLRTVPLDATGTPQTGTSPTGTPLVSDPQAGVPQTGTTIKLPSR